MTTETFKNVPPKSNKIRWSFVEKEGIPAKELRMAGPPDTQYPRTFLVMGHYSMATAYVNEDGSGFITTMDEPVIAWAIIEGF